MIGILLLKYAEESLAAGDIKTPKRGVVEQIVGIADAVELCHNPAGVGIQHGYLSRFAATCEQPVLILVERHGKVLAEARQRPLKRHGARAAVSPGDMPGGGHVYENARPLPLKLK